MQIQSSDNSHQSCDNKLSAGYSFLKSSVQSMRSSLVATIALTTLAVTYYYQDDDGENNTRNIFYALGVSALLFIAYKAYNEGSGIISHITNLLPGSNAIADPPVVPPLPPAEAAQGVHPHGPEEPPAPPSSRAQQPITQTNYSKIIPKTLCGVFAIGFSCVFCITFPVTATLTLAATASYIMKDKINPLNIIKNPTIQPLIVKEALCYLIKKIKTNAEIRLIFIIFSTTILLILTSLSLITSNIFAITLTAKILFVTFFTLTTFFILLSTVILIASYFIYRNLAT